jgi:hypothetical protein
VDGGVGYTGSRFKGNDLNKAATPKVCNQQGRRSLFVGRGNLSDKKALVEMEGILK